MVYFEASNYWSQSFFSPETDMLMKFRADCSLILAKHQATAGLCLAPSLSFIESRTLHREVLVYI